MDDQRNPTAARRAGDGPAWSAGDRVSLYAARQASPEVIRARELRERAERYATRGLIPIGRQPVLRAARPRRTLIASVAALTSLIAGGSAALAGQTVYRVQSGDTLSELAESHGSTVEALASWNDLDDPDLIITGETLLIPLDGEDDAAAVHVVAWGDTLSGIADLYGTTIEALSAINGLSDPDLIVVGDELLIPTTLDADPAPPDIIVQDTGDEEEDDVDPGNMSDDNDDETGSVDDPEAEGDETSDETPAEETPAEEPAETVDGGTDETPADDSGETGTETGDDDTTEAEPEPAPIEIAIAALHLVTEGETLESIADQYGMSVDELLAVNEHAVEGATPGMILVIPEGADAGVQLVGVPSVVAASPDATDAAALAAATGYWGGEIPQEESQAALDEGEYAVDTLAGMLERYGYHPGVFDTSSGSATLTAQIDSGIPVIVWLADESGEHTGVVSGYDDDSVELLDVRDGSTVTKTWDAFQTAWEAGGGAAIAVSPL